MPLDQHGVLAARQHLGVNGVGVATIGKPRRQCKVSAPPRRRRAGRGEYNSVSRREQFLEVHSPAQLPLGKLIATLAGEVFVWQGERRATFCRRGPIAGFCRLGSRTWRIDVDQAASRTFMT